MVRNKWDPWAKNPLLIAPGTLDLSKVVPRPPPLPTDYALHRDAIALSTIVHGVPQRPAPVQNTNFSPEEAQGIFRIGNRLYKPLEAIVKFEIDYGTGNCVTYDGPTQKCGPSLYSDLLPQLQERVTHYFKDIVGSMVKSYYDIMFSYNARAWISSDMSRPTRVRRVLMIEGYASGANDQLIITAVVHFLKRPDKAGYQIVDVQRNPSVIKEAGIFYREDNTVKRFTLTV